MPTAVAPDDVVATRAAIGPGAREPLVVLDGLSAFLDAHAIGSGTPELAAIGDGHSNVTLAVTRGDARAVLRRPPRGPLPPSAHDVLREARVLTALAGQARVPRVLAVGEDPAIIGAPFYVMEHVDGAVVTDAVPPALDAPETTRALALSLVDALVEIHAVDPRAAGLEGFGRPTGYLERQLRRFTGLWEHNRTRDLPAVERVGGWLREHMPADRGPEATTVVHGDFRLGNAVVARRPPGEVVAILDWEMATLGDPLADLGYLCMMWSEAEDPPGGLADLNAVTRSAGFPTRAELVARYEERSGRSMANPTFYLVLALWKAIVFMEGNYRRAVAGSTDDPFLRSFGQGVVDLATRAEALIGGS